MIGLTEILDPVIKTAGGTSYTLTNATVDYGIDDSQDELVRSVIDGKYAIIEHGDYFKAEIDVFGLSWANYAAIKALKGAVVRLWPFGQSAIAGTSPQVWYPYLDALVVAVKPYYRDNAYYYDAAVLTLISEEPYELDRAADDGLGVET
jgi:hypothetical protein